ncbi:Rqc2 family fibronectin-binding protein [Facklamia hominis]|uniref:Rqc2 family fibronectin-binding protein n=1 Tax=Facklamia hominis TaxID=178214 RepID=UPI0028897D0F|nr:NFACT RNA binding domain-containing protein [Facklamia hominis]WPJ91630.1 NFACT RNA binding domain-containing protein [Facklamia hominis]
MSFDGFFTRALTQELTNQLQGGRIHKIYQPFEQELQILIRKDRQVHRLAASAHANYFSLYLSQDKPANPQQAPMFCMLLRKHLEGALLEEIKQYQNDRIIDFIFSGRDEIGLEQTYCLSFELMGRRSNIILINQAQRTIIDCIKHVPSNLNAYRSLTPGASFKRPPHNETQINPYDLNEADLYRFCQSHETEFKSGLAYQLIQGMGKLLAESIAYWMTEEDLSAYQALERVKSAIDYPNPSLYPQEDRVDFYALNLPQFNANKRQSYPSLSSLLESFYRVKIHQDRIKQLTGSILQKVNQVLDKDQKKLKKLAQDKKTAQAADQYRLQGELLNAFAHQVASGSQEVTLANYYNDNQPLTISLDPRLSATDNAQKYFKKYQKYRDALKYVQFEEKKTQEEIDYLEGILVQLSQADLEDVEEIKQELIKQGYVSQKPSKTKKRAQIQSKPRRYQSSDGVMIYVGRNNQQNDQLSLKKASKNHWWLHAKDIPGAHVIVESDKPSTQTLEEAAVLAAYYSKFSQSANVPVDTVQVKNLRKPNGAKPGFVIYEGQQTLYVTPSQEKVQQLTLKED